MSNKALKKLIYDMSQVIRKHGIDNVDSDAAAVIRQASKLSGVGTEMLPYDRAQMIEDIRQANLHPYAA